MNLQTSQAVFLGPYFSTAAERAEFCDDYLLMTEGFLSFPIAFPGTGLWHAIRSRHKVCARAAAPCQAPPLPPM